VDDVHTGTSYHSLYFIGRHLCATASSSVTILRPKLRAARRPGTYDVYETAIWVLCIAAFVLTTHRLIRPRHSTYPRAPADGLEHTYRWRVLLECSSPVFTPSGPTDWWLIGWRPKQEGRVHCALRQCAVGEIADVPSARAI
jgi:hypothetical protein